jgi:hypothetical protein
VEEAAADPDFPKVLDMSIVVTEAAAEAQDLVDQEAPQVHQEQQDQ